MVIHLGVSHPSAGLIYMQSHQLHIAFGALRRHIEWAFIHRLLLALPLCPLVLAGCGGSPSPGDTINALIHALEEGDAATVERISPHEPLRGEPHGRAAALGAAIAIKRAGGIRSVEVLEEVIKGDFASVHWRVTWGDGHDAEADTRLVMIGGQWIIDPDQGSGGTPALVMQGRNEIPVRLSFAGKHKADIMSLTNALRDFATQHDGRYPDNLQALVVTDEQGRRYLKQGSIPLDPWGNEYGYELSESGSRREEPRVFTLGSDGRPAGDGSAADSDNYTLGFSEDLGPSADE